MDHAEGFRLKSRSKQTSCSGDPISMGLVDVRPGWARGLDSLPEVHTCTGRTNHGAIALGRCTKAVTGDLQAIHREKLGAEKERTRGTGGKSSQRRRCDRGSCAGYLFRLAIGLVRCNPPAGRIPTGDTKKVGKTKSSWLCIDIRGKAPAATGAFHFLRERHRDDVWRLYFLAEGRRYTATRCSWSKGRISRRPRTGGAAALGGCVR